MGGTIFTKADGDEPALSCPRMPPAIYHETREHCATILRGFFAHVATPPEAPGKSDYGDVDFHVFGSPNGTPLPPATFKHLLPQAEKALDAARMHVSGDELVSYAVPWATAVHQREADEAVSVTTTSATDNPDASTKRLRLSPPDASTQHYAQVDVILCASLADFHWTTWLHAYGDMTQILAISLRPLGLVFHPHGFVLRDPAIERLDHYTPVGAIPSKRSMADLLLSNDPAAVMRFLGLDVARYEAGFDDEAALFDWLAKGRFMYRETYLHCDGEKHPVPSDANQVPSNDPERHHPTDADQSTSTNADNPTLDEAESPAPDSTTTTTNAETLNPTPTTRSPSTDPQTPGNPRQTARSRASDRRRRTTRPMFARFIDTYLATHADIGTSAPPPRTAVLDAATAFFGQAGARAARVAEVQGAQAEAAFWSAVRGRVPKTGAGLREVVRALRRWVVFGEGVPFVAGAAELDEERVPRWTAVCGLGEGAMLDWVGAHWEEVRARERERTAVELEARRATRAHES